MDRTNLSRWLIPLPAVLFAFFPLKASAEQGQRTWTCSQSSTIQWTMQQPLADYQAGLRPNWSDCLAWQNGEPANYVWSYGASVTTTTTTTTTTTLPASSSSTSSTTTTSEPVATTTTTQQPSTTTTQLATTSTSTLPQETSTTTTTTQPATTTTSSTTTTEVQTPPQTTTTTSTSTTTTSTSTTTVPETTTTAIPTTEMPRSETVPITEPPTTTTVPQTTTTLLPTTTTLEPTTTTELITTTSQTATTTTTQIEIGKVTSVPQSTTTVYEVAVTSTVPLVLSTNQLPVVAIDPIVKLPSIVADLSNATVQQTIEIVYSALASAITQEQATVLTSSAQVLAVVTNEQAETIFKQLDIDDLSGEQVAEVVAVVQDAPVEVRKAFESVINIFDGKTDEYVPIGSNVSVGERRLVVAVTGILIAGSVAIGASQPHTSRKNT